MRHAQLGDMIKGWFVGDFDPSVLRTKECEVAVKRYDAADKETLHHHRIATEITVVVSGRVRMFGRDWEAGSIVIAEPSDATDFEALADTTIVVVKLPSITGDKYPGAAPPAG
ncbi:MAG: hypothetical protein U1E60_19795 [Reyranellaceae bacterium]